jgi:twitching motility protein PilU
LFRQGRISEEEALKNADSRNNLRLKIQLSDSKTPETANQFAGLALSPKD